MGWDLEQKARQDAQYNHARQIADARAREVYERARAAEAARLEARREQARREEEERRRAQEARKKGGWW